MLSVNAVTLSETLYVASRIHEAAGVSKPNREALNHIYWLKRRAGVIYSRLSACWSWFTIMVILKLYTALTSLVA